MAGRPSKRTPEVVAKLEYAFALGGHVAAACHYAGVSESTFYSWGEEDPDFRERMNLLKQKPILKALETVNASLDDPAMAKWYLEKRNPEFKPKVEFENETPPARLIVELTDKKADQAEK